MGSLSGAEHPPQSATPAGRVLSEVLKGVSPGGKASGSGLSSSYHKAMKLCEYRDELFSY